MYKIIHNNHKKLFMSATPRVYEIEDEDDEEFEKETFGEVIYKMSFNEAITNNYITDYSIWLPSIHEDNTELTKELSIYEIDNIIKSKCMFLYSCLLNNGSRKCIIYCIDTNEIKLMKEAMNKLNEFYLLDIEMNEITSSTTEKNRKIRLNNFAKSDKIYLMFSVRILDECIDIPSCDSIYITYPSNSKIRTIQRLSRCIRIDKNNKFKKGNIFIWCDEYNEILETLSGIKEYDINFKDKIKVNENGFYKLELKEDLIKDVKLIENYIMGIKEFKFVSWHDKFDMLQKYIDENNCRPSIKNKNINIKKLGMWWSQQQDKYKKKINIMKNKEIYNLWTKFINNDKYKNYFMSYKENWYLNFELVKQYIDKYHKRPSHADKNKEFKQIGTWIHTQQKNYKKKEQLMKQKEIYDKWTEFINNNKYKKYFMSNEEEWFNNLDKVKIYIDENHKRPPQHTNDKIITQLSKWIGTQLHNYKKKDHIMKQTEIYDGWTSFINVYKEHFLNNNELWYINLDEVKKYIDENNKIPSQHNINKEIKQIGQWISDQKKI